VAESIAGLSLGVPNTRSRHGKKVKCTLLLPDVALPSRLSGFRANKGGTSAQTRDAVSLNSLPANSNARSPYRGSPLRRSPCLFHIFRDRLGVRFFLRFSRIRRLIWPYPHLDFLLSVFSRCRELLRPDVEVGPRNVSRTMRLYHPLRLFLCLSTSGRAISWSVPDHLPQRLVRLRESNLRRILSALRIDPLFSDGAGELKTVVELCGRDLMVILPQASIELATPRIFTALVFSSKMRFLWQGVGAVLGLSCQELHVGRTIAKREWRSCNN